MELSYKNQMSSFGMMHDDPLKILDDKSWNKLPRFSWRNVQTENESCCCIKQNYIPDIGITIKQIQQDSKNL